MELDREFIVRADFQAARRGYDQEEVDRHLQEVAEAVEELKRTGEGRDTDRSGSSGSIAGAAADQVRAIVEAAEHSAAAIEAGATEEADRVTGEATHHAEQERNKARGEAERLRGEAESAARETRESAEAEAAEHLTSVQEATSGMRERADVVETDMTGLVDQLRTTIESLVESVRSSAGSLQSELESIHAGLADVRGPAAAEGLGPESVEEGKEDQATAQTDIVRPDKATGDAEGEDPDQHPDAREAVDELPYEEPQGSDEPEEGGALDDEVAESEEPPLAAAGESDPAEGARLIALNMALNGTPREETASYLGENFDLEDQEAILDEVYARVGG